MHILSRILVAIAATSTLAACAPMGSAGQNLADKAGGEVGCQSFQQTFWDEMDQIPLDDLAFPSAEAMRIEFENALARRLPNARGADREALSEALTDLYRTLTVDAVRALRVDEQSKEEILGLITSIEIGDRTTAEKSAIQDTVREKFEAIERVAKSLEPAALPACSTTPPSGSKAPTTPVPAPAKGTLFAEWKATRHPAVYGGLKTFATSYQSCQVGTSPAITKSVQDLQGIKIVGTASDGVGSLREISDLPALLRTHPYLATYKKPAASCFDVTASPLIYDYGGRPVVSSTGVFDFFKNSGPTKVLGTDCSGYVYMALATAGLRIKSGVKLKGSTIYGVSSHLFVNPQSNGLT
ncbi:MAG: hypothetical protein AAB250_10155, partial [Bdellovibrionota bacterium]